MNLNNFNHKKQSFNNKISKYAKLHIYAHLNNFYNPDRVALDKKNQRRNLIALLSRGCRHQI